MRLINHSAGEFKIDEDGDVLVRLADVKLDDITPLDISDLRPEMDALARLYLKAQTSEQTEDADAYKRHKERVLTSFNGI